jgi:hypothetical protein
MASVGPRLPLSDLDEYVSTINDLLAPYNPVYLQSAWSSVSGGFIRTRDFKIGAVQYNMYACIRQDQLAFGIGSLTDFGTPYNCQAYPNQIQAQTWTCITSALGPPPSTP